MLRILFIGSLGIQSVETLKGLLASGQKVAVIALAGSTLGLPAAASWKRRYIPVIDGNAPNNIQHVAASEGIPIEILDPLDPGTRLRPHTPDIGVVSCFPHRLHENLLKLPAFGCYNLHPSLLPQYRGPTPLFWQLRQGETETGVTLHKMCAGIDTGDIVAQQRLLIDDGISELELGRRCASSGVELVRLLLKNLPSGNLTLTCQDEQRASYYGWPVEQAFQLSIDWTARRISNFVRGTEHRGRPYHLRIGADCFSIRAVEGCLQQPMREHDYRLEGGRIVFNCRDGSIRARLTD